MDIQKFFPAIITVKFIELFKRQKPATAVATEEKTSPEKEVPQVETAETKTEARTTETKPEAKNTGIIEEKPVEKQ